jgi:hypothetical protein
MVTMKDIRSIRDVLKKLKPTDLAGNTDKPLSNRDAIKQLAPTLLKMRKRGFTVSTKRTECTGVCFRRTIKEELE